MFYNGADKLYRASRKCLKRLSRVAPFLFPQRKPPTHGSHSARPLHATRALCSRWRGSCVCMVCGTGKHTSEAEYVRTLPAALQYAARRRGVRALMEKLTCREAVTHYFGPVTLVELRAMWSKAETPRFLTLHLLHATNIPPLDACDTSDAYCIACARETRHMRTRPPRPPPRARHLMLTPHAHTSRSHLTLTPPVHTPCSHPLFHACSSVGSHNCSHRLSAQVPPSARRAHT
jgi:hypothetical protein